MTNKKLRKDETPQSGEQGLNEILDIRNGERNMKRRRKQERRRRECDRKKERTRNGKERKKKE